MRATLGGLRSLLSPSLLRRAQELALLNVRGAFVKEPSDQAMLNTAFSIAGQKVAIRRQQTLDAETREAHESLLRVARFAEEALVGLAERYVPPSKRKQCEGHEQLVVEGAMARDHLCKANLRLVVSIAKRGKYQWGDLTLLDRIQEGNIGLMQAVDGFDPETYGTRLSTYAVESIKWAIDRAVKNQTGVIRRPVHVHEMVWQFRQSLNDIESDRGQVVPAEAGMEELHLTPLDRATIRLGSRPQEILPLLAEDGEDCSCGRGDRGVDEAAATDARESVERFRSGIRSLLAVLTEREAQIITLRLSLNGGEPKIQREIGELFGFTRGRVYQIEAQAIAKLQAATGVKPVATNGRSRATVTHGSYAELFESIVSAPPDRERPPSPIGS